MYVEADNLNNSWKLELVLNGLEERTKRSEWRENMVSDVEIDRR